MASSDDERKKAERAKAEREKAERERMRRYLEQEVRRLTNELRGLEDMLAR